MSVAEAYLNGNGVDEDAAEAIKYFVLAGNLGCDEARAKADKLLSERELRYNEGVNAETSCIDDAFRAYAISASMGHTGAMVSLAHILRDGRSKIKNRGGACMLYKRAAELGEDEALLHLGRCYAEGIGVERDFDMARELLSKAERLGVPGTQELITDIMNKKMKKLAGRIYSTGMRLVHQNKYAEAKRLVEIASDFCSPKATYALGCFYEFGIGTKCDKKRAYEYYEKPPQ